MPREEKNCIASGSKHFNMGVLRIHSNLKYQRLLLGVNIINNTIWEMN